MTGVLVRFPDEKLAAIDQLRRDHETRPEAIRRLVDKGIEHWDTPDRLKGVRT